MTASENNFNGRTKKNWTAKLYLQWQWPSCTLVLTNTVQAKGEKKNKYNFHRRQAEVVEDLLFYCCCCCERRQYLLKLVHIILSTVSSLLMNRVSQFFFEVIIWWLWNLYVWNVNMCVLLSLIDWLMITYIALFSALLSRLTALACGSTWVTSFL